MKVIIEPRKITIFSSDDFNIGQILESGQAFRYKRTDFGYEIYSLHHKASIYCQKAGTTIFCDDEKYFKNYFDIDNDYGKIKLDLKGNDFLDEAIEGAKGVRILKQNPLETIITFIISANNNIPRIKKSIEKLCDDNGELIDGYHAFPTIEKLSTLSQEYFKSIGCGYRDKYLVKTIHAIHQGFPINKLFNLPTQQAKKLLLQLPGVGGKVADCILLFAYKKTDLFPMDTWSQKVYWALCMPQTDKINEMSNNLVARFGNLSGYAQQYLYYY